MKKKPGKPESADTIIPQQGSTKPDGAAISTGPNLKPILDKLLQPKSGPKMRPDEHLHELAEALNGPRTSASVEKKIRRHGEHFINSVRRDQRLRNAVLLHFLRYWVPVTAREIAIAMGRPDSAITRLKRQGALPQHVRIGRTDYWSAIEIALPIIQAKIDHLEASINNAEKMVGHTEQSMAEAHAVAVALLDAQDIVGEPKADDGADQLS